MIFCKSKLRVTIVVVESSSPLEGPQRLHRQHSNIFSRYPLLARFLRSLDGGRHQPLDEEDEIQVDESINIARDVLVGVRFQDLA